jgi:hypothetical protein
MKRGEPWLSPVTHRSRKEKKASFIASAGAFAGRYGEIVAGSGSAQAIPLCLSYPMVYLPMQLEIAETTGQQ